MGLLLELQIPSALLLLICVTRVANCKLPVSINNVCISQYQSFIITLQKAWTGLNQSPLTSLELWSYCKSPFFKNYDYLGDDFLNSRYAMFCQPTMNETCELKVRRSCKVVQGARCTSHCEQCLWCAVIKVHASHSAGIVWSWRD